MTYITTGLAAAPYLDNTAPRPIGSFGQNVCWDRLQGIPHFIANHLAYQQQSETQYLML